MRVHILCSLLCLGRRTLTGIITTSGGQWLDWSAHYRLYSRDRVDPEKCFDVIRQGVQDLLKPQAPLVVAIDDTIKPKRGVRIDGVGFRRDPLGPKFRVNLVLAQRFLQFSAAVPASDGSARLIPIDFLHAPGAKKPRKKADALALAQYKEEQKQANLNYRANQRIARLREVMDPGRELMLVVDGSYTNGAVIKKLPQRTTLIGRIRKDAVLSEMPKPTNKPGRRPSYGPERPTPEQIRGDDKIPWLQVRAYAAGKTHVFKVKVVKKVLWRKCGAKRQLQLIIIAPLGYRLRKNSRMLYRQPAYLICTDSQLDLQQLLQYYLWRWQIEVNFRDQKSLLGMGEAQVRTRASNRNLPAINVAAYSMLWLASLEANPSQKIENLLPPAKWRADLKHRERPTTSALLQSLRYDAWAGSLRPSSFYHFTDKDSRTAKSQKPTTNIASALFQTN